jgi:hypothetical protein
MEASAKRRGRAVPVALGIIAIIVAVLWVLFWGAVVLAAWAFGGDDATGWVIVGVSLVAGVLVFVLGVSLVRGRRPSRVGWSFVVLAVLAVLAMPVDAALDDEEAAPVNLAVQRAYMQRSGLGEVEADCDMVFENPDGSEFWECIMESATHYDICEVDIRRERGPIAATIGDCVNGTSRR